MKSIPDLTTEELSLFIAEQMEPKPADYDDCEVGMRTQSVMSPGYWWYCRYDYPVMLRVSVRWHPRLFTVSEVAMKLLKWLIDSNQLPTAAFEALAIYRRSDELERIIAEAVALALGWEAE